jgi:hypothetical protein
MELPASPSRKVLTTGIPPATEASKASATPFFGERGFRGRECGAFLAPDQFDEKPRRQRCRDRQSRCARETAWRQSPRSRRVGDDKEWRQKGFLPDFRDAIKAARKPQRGQSGEARGKEAKLNLAKSSDSNHEGFCGKKVAEFGAKAEPFVGRQKSCGCRHRARPTR